MIGFFVQDEDGKEHELEVLVDGGPLCVAGIWDFDRERLVPSLYWVYVKKFGMRIGPYYASLLTAEREMRKALKIQPGLWDQEDLGWFARQAWLIRWIEKNMGRPEDLIGGVWAKD